MKGKYRSNRRRIYGTDPHSPFAPKHHKCVTCGKTSVNYRCDRCKKKWLNKHNLSHISNIDDDWAEMA